MDVNEPWPVLSIMDYLFQNEDLKAPESVPEHADVVVIGGGSLGSSTLYHLMKHGVKNAVLLEKDQLTAGTTWHSAGLVWRLRPSDIEAELLNYTRDLGRDVLEEETGVAAGFNENGGLFIANNKERLDEYKRLMTVCINVYFDYSSYLFRIISNDFQGSLNNSLNHVKTPEMCETVRIFTALAGNFCDNDKNKDCTTLFRHPNAKNDPVNLQKLNCR